MKSHPLVVAVLLALSPLAALAQLGLYGTFSAANLNHTSYDNWIYGGTVGGYLDHGHFAVLSTGVDLRGTFVDGATNAYDSGSVGPRLALRPYILPVKPYVEALIGVGHATFSGSPATNSVTKFEYQFLGGADFTILPRIDWRVVEFSYGGLSGLNGSSFHPTTISTGIVVRLPWL